MKKKINPGDKVVHKSIDAEDGFAKTGVTKEVIVEEDQTIIAAEWVDEEKAVGFDDREIVKLAPFSDPSPVILKPRHLKTLLRSRNVRAAIVFAIMSAILLAVINIRFQLNTDVTVLAAAVLLGFSLLIFNRVRP